MIKVIKEQSVVGVRIREKRMALGLSATQLAKRAGIAPSTVTHAENHEHLPRLPSLIKIAGALGVDVADLLS